MVSKEQERKALNEIKEILLQLEPDGYVRTAFDGCFQIAEDNINNDFACSMKQRAESAERQAQQKIKAIRGYQQRDAPRSGRYRTDTCK